MSAVADEMDDLCGLGADDFIGIVDQDCEDHLTSQKVLEDAAATREGLRTRGKDALAKLAVAHSSYGDSWEPRTVNANLPAAPDTVAFVKPGMHMIEDDDLLVSFSDLEHADDIFQRAGLCVFPEGAMDELQIQRHRTNCNSDFSKIKTQLAIQSAESTDSFNFNEVCRRQFGRFDVRQLCAPDASLFKLHAADAASVAPWSGFVQQVLGESAVELNRGAVINSYGSDAQNWHRDGDPLWPHVHLPPHCITVFVPLVDLDDTLGPTQFYPGSHDVLQAHQYMGLDDKDLDVQCSLPLCAPLVAEGGAIAFDYRIIHRGTGNTDHVRRVDRPVLYFVYALPWFADTYNHPTDKPLFEDRADDPLVCEEA
jgi:ectoine hydroxylase-related dioxygenase (phytanoyl-CoA dioxygenase family)